MKKRLKILQISPGVPPLVGGEEKCTYIIYKKLNRALFNVSILVGKNQRYKKTKIPIIQCPTNGTPLNYLITFIKFLIHAKDADIIHFQYPNFLFPNVTFGLVLLLVSRILKKPYIVHIHLILKFQSKFWLKLIFLYNKYFKNLLKNANLILIPTNYSKNLLIRQFDLDPAKFVVLPNGIDRHFLEIKQEKTNEFQKILFIGRFSREKNIDKLIRAVKKMPDNIYLHIYGSGSEENNLKKIAEDHKNIIFKGRLPQSEIVKAYQGAKLMVLPSSNEELPITILEALASEVSVLCTPLPSVQSFFNKKIFYTTGTIDDLIKQISMFLNQDLEQNHQEGRAFAKKYTWENFASQLERIYVELLKK